MTDAQSPLGIRYAARSDAGTARTSNEDVAYAGARLLAVADGIRGSGGDRVGAAAIDALKPLEVALPAGDLLNALSDAAEQAGRAVRDVAADNPEAVTTLTAMLWSGTQLGLVHIGDSRAYLLRDGELLQITHDHTYVQTLVDAGPAHRGGGGLPPAAGLAGACPGRLGSGAAGHLAARGRAGDRYLLCSDGLSAVVDADSLAGALRADADPEQVVGRLIELAYQGGAPDNIACVVADVVAI